MDSAITSGKFQKNLELFHHFNPKVAVMLPYVDCGDLSLLKNDKGEWNLAKKIEGKTSSYHAPEGALKEAKNWFSKQKLEGAEILYVYGLGLGYYYDAAKMWLQKNPKHHLIFLEDDLAVLHRFMETDKAVAILKDPQVQIHFFRDPETEKELFDWLSWHFVMSPFEISALNYYAKTKPRIFELFKHKITYDSANKFAHVDEYLKYGVAFFKNFYPNLLLLDKSYFGNGLFGKFKNVPAIICGAGPSLNKNLSLLREYEDKALIFAGGSALNALNEKNLQPHFGAGLDPNLMQFDRLSTNKAFEIPFFYRNRMFHDAFKMIHGPRLYVTGAGGYDAADWFEKELGIPENSIEEGHNVVNFCVEIANALGCNPIIFVGVDLGYTGMKAYAKGVIGDPEVAPKEEMDMRDLNTVAILRKDIYGKPIYTLWKWVAESEWIAEYAKTHPDVTLINATEGGLGFPGVPNQKLREVAAKYLKKTYDLRGRIHGEIQNSPLKKVTQKKVIAAIGKFRESLGRCVDYCQNLIDEIKVVKDAIKKGNEVAPSLQTGRAALFETELVEEPGYIYHLDIFNQVYIRILNRDIQRLNSPQSRLSEKQKNMKKLEVNEQRFIFLRDVARANLEMIRWGFKSHEG